MTLGVILSQKVLMWDTFSYNSFKNLFKNNFLKGKSLKQLIDECVESNNDIFIGNKSFIWIKQLVKALEFLHTSQPEKIIHGNLNPK